MSDLDFMKKFAKIYDYEPPQVKWVAGVGEVLQLRSRQDAVMQSPDEVMRYLPSSNSSMFGAEKAQIADLTIDDDTGDMPTSVEVVGYDADGQIVMVRADYSPIGVQVSTDYDWASQHEEAAGLVQDGVMLKLMAQGEGNSTLPSGGFSVVQGAGGSALMPADDTSTDVIHGSFVESSLTAQAYAASYFADKMSKFRVMNGSYGKLKGIEKIAVHNVYRLEGVAKKQRGKYITTNVRHNLSRQNGHRVSFGARVVVASGTKLFSTFTV